MRNLHEILGIDEKADKKKIKRAYRDLAKKHHPDKGGDEKIFKDINFAYTVLMDDELFAKYKRGEDLQAEVNHPLQIIVEVFSGLLMRFNQFSNENLVAKTKEVVDVAIDHFEDDIEKNKKKLAEFNSAKKKIKFKGQGENILSKCLDQFIDEAKNNIKNLTIKVNHHKKAFDILQDYDFLMNQTFKSADYIVDSARYVNFGTGT